MTIEGNRPKMINAAASISIGMSNRLGSLISFSSFGFLEYM